MHPKYFVLPPFNMKLGNLFDLILTKLHLFVPFVYVWPAPPIMFVQSLLAGQSAYWSNSLLARRTHRGPQEKLHEKGEHRSTIQRKSKKKTQRQQYISFLKTHMVVWISKRGKGTLGGLATEMNQNNIILFIDVLWERSPFFSRRLRFIEPLINKTLLFCLVSSARPVHTCVGSIWSFLWMSTWALTSQ